MDLTYRDAPEVMTRYSFSYSKAGTPGLAYFRHLEGFLPARGEIAEPFLVRYLP
jgi:hypothetical protein